MNQKLQKRRSAVRILRKALRKLANKAADACAPRESFIVQRYKMAELRREVERADKIYNTTEDA